MVWEGDCIETSSGARGARQLLPSSFLSQSPAVHIFANTRSLSIAQLASSKRGENSVALDRWVVRQDRYDGRKCNGSSDCSIAFQYSGSS